MPSNTPQGASPSSTGDFLSLLFVSAGSVGLLLYLVFWSAEALPRRDLGQPSGKNQARPPAFALPRSPGVITGAKDYHGQPVLANCGTCHATRPANPAVRLATSLKQFHQGLTMKHGNLACVACHNPGDGYQSLRLADGRAVPFGEAITLCAQCHGPQFRDYQHGAHGGMTGYWDTSRGPRHRNTCIACHDPHAPAYPTVRPAPGPNDRFLFPPAKVRHD